MGDDERALRQSLDGVRDGLERLLAASIAHAARAEPGEPAAPAPVPPRLAQLATALGLDAFEQHVVLLAAGCELDGRIAELVAELHGDPDAGRPTFGLALLALDGATHKAATPAGPLRYWRLVEPGAGPVLRAPLELDERVLDQLLGVEHLDERLAGLVQPWAGHGEALTPPQETAAADLRQAWRAPEAPVVHLQAPTDEEARGVAVTACAHDGLRLCRIDGADVPEDVTARTALARLWDREAALGEVALLVEHAELRPAARLADALHGPVVVLAATGPDIARRPLRTVHVAPSTPQQRRALWSGALGDRAAALNGTLDTVAAQFDLPPSRIREAVARAGALAGGDDDAIARELWATSRAAARVRLDDLAERLEPSATWEDLVLPSAQLDTLHEIAAHVRRRPVVHHDWGFAVPGARGLGVAALFAGASGTGKTMAAEVLAAELQLDLFRIDLSGVVSKYVGETEKNLRRVFAAAEAGGAILLFDEADALFGKRSEVRDSHDRYANIEVSYLLQRMEAYRGLAVLTTNMQEAIDPGFLRRLRFVVGFPFPDAAQRETIWRRIFPPGVPVDDLDPQRLAALSVAGGSIRSIALGAAFLAADEGRAVAMRHVERAARSEFAKLERPFPGLDREAPR